MKILTVDDQSEIRKILMAHLRQWGYNPIPACNGQEAWEILEKEDINFVITDWMMPEMTGIELCRKIRASKRDKYIYIIILTAKENKTELIEGMEAGADDFVVKPFNKNELKVRIKAGVRILTLEKELEERNKKLNDAYSIIKRDLEAAAKMQKSLLPEKTISISGVNFDWLFCPSSFLAGDIFNFFQLDKAHISFYLLDVAGHGIPAAMLSVTLSNFLSPELLRGSDNSNVPTIIKPSEIIKELNKRYQNDRDGMQYFTMIYGIIDLKNGKVTLTQAGHPSPIYIEHNGKVNIIGEGGFPVGMLPDMNYEDQEFFINKGDRLFIYSDGIIECCNSNMMPFSMGNLIRILSEGVNIPLSSVIKKVENELNNWKEGNEFEDDITLVAMEII